MSAAPVPACASCATLVDRVRPLRSILVLADSQLDVLVVPAGS